MFCFFAHIHILIDLFAKDFDQTGFLSFQSLSNIMGASMEDLARCPGIGERKVYYQWNRTTIHSYIFEAVA